MWLLTILLGGSITGVVRDSASGAPIAGAVVSLSTGAVARTDTAGHYVLPAPGPGAYVVQARRLGYAAATRSVVLEGQAPVAQVDFRLVTVASTLRAVTVTGGAPVAIDPRTGDQSFEQHDYHGAPTTTTSQIIQQSIAGAARAPTGEVHIRGQHAEYTYYVDGVPVPQSIGGTLNELFDPAIVDRIGFQTGGWDAEYGNKNIAVVNVTTRIPTGGLHTQLSAYTGSFNSDGQTALVTTNSGPFGVLLSASRTETSMRREPLEANAQGVPLNFHNAGQDQYGFAKLEYTPSTGDVVTLDVNASRTHAGIPYDSSFGVLNDHQTDVNGFVNLGWQHGAHVFTALYLRRSTLDYIPGASDVPRFTFYPDTTDRYTVRSTVRRRPSGPSSTTPSRHGAS
jgi:hypothetical protein